MSKFSRDKGKSGEREVCEILRPVFPWVSRRLGQEREAADNGRDLDGTFPFVFQVKRHATVSPALRFEALEQAEIAARDSGPGTGWYGVALWREDRGPWRVSCRLGTFIDAPGDVLDGMAGTAHDADHALVVELDLGAFLAWWSDMTDLDDLSCAPGVVNSQQDHETRPTVSEHKSYNRIGGIDEEDIGC